MFGEDKELMECECGPVASLTSPAEEGLRPMYLIHSLIYEPIFVRKLMLYS